MNTNLTGKTALVTGSTAGIGFSVAADLAKLGATVFINGRTEDRIDQAIKKLAELPFPVKADRIAADLSTAEGVAHLIEKVPSIDILVNNVGIFEPKNFLEIPDEDWQRIFEINVMSGVRLSRHYLPKMLEKGWGRIVFVSSEAALNTPVNMVHYGMTKACQLSISRGLAELTKGTQVTVNSVLPGPTSSEGLVTYMNKLAVKQNTTVEKLEKEYFQSVNPTSLIQRYLTEAEVASQIVYLCTPGASGTNGSNVRVEGGILNQIS